MKTKTKPAKLSAAARAKVVKAVLGKRQPKAVKVPAKPKGSADARTKERPAPIAALAPIKIRKEEREIPLAAIVPSPQNRTITPDGLAPEFLDSLRTWGILERLWIYPLATDDKRRKGGVLYELIAGERRWCGGGLVGLKLAPVTIFHCTAAQADELRIIENLHREDLTELEEGRSFLRLMDTHGFAVRDDRHPERSIHHLINQSESYIFGRIKLVQAPKIVQEAVAAGTLNGSIALRVARISDPAAQVKAVREFSDFERFHGEALTDKRAAEWIEENYQRQLKGAPFDPRDADLVPVEHDERKARLAGGTCDDCPMRSGNQPRELLPAEGKNGSKGRGDMCLNPACYQRKVDAAWQATTRGFSGIVLPDEDSRAIFTGWASGGGDALGSNCRYVFPTDKCPEDPLKRSYGELLGQPHPLSVTRFLVRSHRTGKAHALLLRAECKAAIIAAGQHTFYDALSDQRRASNAEELIHARQDALAAEDMEWQLGYLIDQLARNPVSGWLIHPAIFPAMVSALSVQINWKDIESSVADTLRRWTVLPKGERPTAAAPAFIATLQPVAAQAFTLEIALRRLLPFGGIEALGEAIETLEAECGIEVSAALEKHHEDFATARQEGRRVTIPVHPDLIAEIEALPGLTHGKSPKSFTHAGRHYVSVRLPGQPADDCWELVPVGAFEGKTCFELAPDRCTARGWNRDGFIVKQHGLEFALCGPRRHFTARETTPVKEVQI